MSATFPDTTAIARRLQDESLSGAWLATRLGVDTAKLDLMRRDGELIGVRLPGDQTWFYPAWQFRGGRPRRIVPAISREARAAGLDELRLYEVMTMRLGLGGERRLADLLVEGDDDAVLAGIRTSTPRR
jgi:hypothetical protein